MCLFFLLIPCCVNMYHHMSIYVRTKICNWIPVEMEMLNKYLLLMSHQFHACLFRNLMFHYYYYYYFLLLLLYFSSFFKCCWHQIYPSMAVVVFGFALCVSLGVENSLFPVILVLTPDSCLLPLGLLALEIGNHVLITDFLFFFLISRIKTITIMNYAIIFFFGYPFMDFHMWIFFLSNFQQCDSWCFVNHIYYVKI